MTISRDPSTVILAAATALMLGGGGASLMYHRRRITSKSRAKTVPEEDDGSSHTVASEDVSCNCCHEPTSPAETVEVVPEVLPCIRNRRSVFPSQFHKNLSPLPKSVIDSLLEAALWGPFHGKCHKDCKHPARFVVLGKKAMVDMQRMTLDYYDKNWQQVGWGSRATPGTPEEYEAWRQMTEGEITGRWGPCSHMIAIVARRQSGPRRFPLWEELAATAAAVQNMHLQSTQFPELACYWSSWHEAARDSFDMKNFLGMKEEDVCMGFFIVAQVKRQFKDRRTRDPALLEVEFRP